MANVEIVSGPGPHINLQPPKTVGLFDIDGLIKFVLFTILAVIPFYFHKTMSLGLLAVYLVIITLLFRMKARTLLISASSYLVIVLIPYLFGLLMNSLISSFSNHNIIAYTQGTDQIFLRLLKLFIIWYVSILYFHTTPIKTVLGLLDRLLFPLKLAGLPVQDYLTVAMCAVQELKEAGTEMKQGLEKSMRSVFGGQGAKFKLNIKGLAQVIVSLIVNSFSKLDRLENLVENADPAELYNYHFRLSKREIIVILSFTLFISLIIMIEKGYLFYKILP